MKYKTIEKNVERWYNEQRGKLDMLNDKSLVTVATISTLYKNGFNDKCEIIKPFILYILSQTYEKNQTIGIKKIVEKLDTDYGLKNVPEAVIIRILSKLSKGTNPFVKLVRNYSKHTYVYVHCDNRIIDDFKKRESEANNSVKIVAEKIVDFFSHMGYSINLLEAKIALFNYLDKYGFEYILFNDYKNISPDVEKNNYILSTFIYDEFQSKSSLVKHILNIFKGLLLTNAIYSSNDIIISKNLDLKKLSIYIDAPLMLNMLELKSEEENALVRPLKNLLPENMNLKCFSHNVDEVKNIIENYKTKKTGMTLEKFDNMLYDSSLIDFYLLELDKHIVENKIEIDTISSFDSLTNNSSDLRGLLEQEKLEEFLKENIQSYKTKPQMLKADVDSIMYVSLIRKGKTVNNIDDCKAIFLTSNSNLAMHCRKFLSENKGISLLVTDIEFIAALWVNNTQCNEDFSKDMLVSLALATQNTIPDKFIERLKIEMERLKRCDFLSEENYNSFINNFQFKKILLDETKGDSELIQDKFVVAQEKYETQLKQQGSLESQAEIESLKLQLKEKENKKNETIRNSQINAENKVDKKIKRLKVTLNILSYSLLVFFTLTISILFVIQFIDENSSNVITFLSIMLWGIDILGVIDLFMSKRIFIQKFINTFCDKQKEKLKAIEFKKIDLEAEKY